MGGGAALSTQAAWATQTLALPTAAPAAAVSPPAATVSRGELALRARAPPAAATEAAAPAPRMSCDQQLSRERGLSGASPRPRTASNMVDV